jgi:uncharacterized protein YdhG (YjbR/CyaY superfamily)
MYNQRMSVITDYIAQLEDTNKQAQLQRVYQLVHDAIPEVQDGWKYGISTLLYKEKPILGFAATLKGISIYPYGNSTIAPLLEKEIAPYVTGGGTLSFRTGTAIPDELVQKITTVRKDYVEAQLKK